MLSSGESVMRSLALGEKFGKSRFTYMVKERMKAREKQQRQRELVSLPLISARRDVRGGDYLRAMYMVSSCECTNAISSACISEDYAR
jgi:hypothetical protein